MDVLKVLRPVEGNQYLLVVQDYFSKWPFARVIADQTAERIVQVLRVEVLDHHCVFRDGIRELNTGRFVHGFWDEEESHNTLPPYGG